MPGGVNSQAEALGTLTWEHSTFSLKLAMSQYSPGPVMQSITLVPLKEASSALHNISPTSCIFCIYFLIWGLTANTLTHRIKEGKHAHTHRYDNHKRCPTAACVQVCEAGHSPHCDYFSFSGTVHAMRLLPCNQQLYLSTPKSVTL